MYQYLFAFSWKRIGLEILVSFCCEGEGNSGERFGSGRKMVVEELERLSVIMFLSAQLRRIYDICTISATSSQINGNLKCFAIYMWSVFFV